MARTSQFTHMQPLHHVSRRNEYRPALNIGSFLELLRDAVKQTDSERTGRPSRGEGRKRPHSPDNTSRKTRKTSSTTKARADEDSVQNFQEQWQKLKRHPVFYSNDMYSRKLDGLQKGVEYVPVLSHTVYLRFSDTECPESDADLEVEENEDAAVYNWKAEEANIKRELSASCEQLSEPLTVDLSNVHLGGHNGGFEAARPTSVMDGAYSWLFSVPPLVEEGFTADDYDLPFPLNNILLCAGLLARDNRAKLEASLKAVLHPLSESQSLPFTLVLEIRCFLVTPTIFEPFSMKWKLSAGYSEAQRRLLLYIFPHAELPTLPQDASTNIPFLYSAIGPAPKVPPASLYILQPKGLLPTLLPFQRRSVAWLLSREGMSISSDGTSIVPNPDAKEFMFWERVEESAYTWYLNRLTGTLAPKMESEEPAFGGMDSEEPGLGKTLECISLVLLNPAPKTRHLLPPTWHEESKVEAKPIKTSLIVTPPSLSAQWRDEIANHSPSLKVYVYEGWNKLSVPTINEGKKTAPKKISIAPGDWTMFVNDYDIVITTYNVLKNDIHVARAAPDRPRREDANYSILKRERSPLIQVEWYRVIMDEVQMAGGRKVEDMVSLIPRRASFAVSGTPAKAQVSDLIHVLRFLRVDHLVSPAKIWNRLQFPGYQPELARLFSHYAIRTRKTDVERELTIPQQTRFLVSIKMGAIERHVYDRTLEEFLQQLGLDARGVAASEGWEIDSSLLRVAVRRLRSICTHPQIGQLQRTNDRMFKPGALKSMADVLLTMKEQNWRSLMDDWKSRAQALIRIAQLKQKVENDRLRYQKMLASLGEAEDEVNKMIKNIEDALEEHRQTGEILKKETADARSNPNGKSRATNLILSEESGDEDSGSDEDEEDRDLPKTPAGEEHRSKWRALQQRLREAQIVLHQVKFLMGDAYHTLGNVEKENAAYDAAESIRRRVLKITEEEAIRGMGQLAEDISKKGVDQDMMQIQTPFLKNCGIKAETQIQELHDIMENVLNAQCAVLWRWRGQIYQMLTQSLTAQEGDANGEEYQASLNTQGRAEVYLQAYTALLADRRESLSSERTLLATHDAREKRLRHTKAAMRAAEAAEIVEEGLHYQPEDEAIKQELMMERRDLLQLLAGRSIKTVLVALNNIQAGIQKETPEKTLVKDAVTKLRKFLTEQNNMLATLDNDLALFRKAFNQRILYFRQLQEISDSVVDIELEKTLVEYIEETENEQQELLGKINTTRARQRYLDHLAKDREQKPDADEDEDSCILCRCEFKRGFITHCAHMFCEQCLRAWVTKTAGKTCPVCRVPIDVDNLQRFSVDQGAPSSKPARQINVHGEAIPKSKRQITYNMIDEDVMKEIQNMDTFGDHGNKIQTLVQHLLYIQETDPGAKSIVFSAWADSLTIVNRALHENGIQCVRIDQGGKADSAAKRFKTDPEVSVLLLHGERENAGLNVTVASRVFLLESVVNHGFEIQAISRIDRMGQSKPTEVYCYYAEDTIERNILDLAARKGLSLYLKENSTGTLNVSSLDVEDKRVDKSIKKQVQKGDFVSKLDDMLAILFPHMYEDWEYLVDGDGAMGDAIQEDASVSENAVAGPSRLH